MAGLISLSMGGGCPFFTLACLGGPIVWNVELGKWSDVSIARICRGCVVPRGIEPLSSNGRSNKGGTG